ncbi:MAG: tetratricopeptide repeat protein, partial [Gemmatimonadetes bacterium]|nr:tetratricopeptide repeat protein [Gemmatimonadota bacterium]
ASAQSVDDAETALTTGRYDDAIEAFDRLVGRQPTARAARGLVEALAAVGRYDEAVARGRRYIEAHRDGRHVWNTVGEV